MTYICQTCLVDIKDTEVAQNHYESTGHTQYIPQAGGWLLDITMSHRIEEDNN